MSQNQRIKTMLFAPSLRGGGAERVTVHLLTHLDRRHFDPTLILVQKEGAFLASLPDDVELIALDRSRVRYALPDLIRLLRARRPDVLVSVMRQANGVALLAKLCAPRSIRLVVTEHSPLSLAVRQQSVGQLRVALLRRLYPLADGIVAVSRGVKMDLAQVLNLRAQDIQVIYNPVTSAAIYQLRREPVTHPWFASGRTWSLLLSCGRLARAKGFDCLIRAVAAIRHETPIRLAIMGQGGEEARLKCLVRELELEDSVAFLGYRVNPYKYMARADVFVLPSRWEGLGLALIEAMACGTPVVSTDCPYGPGEIITDGVDGLLVPPGDIEALAEAAVRILNDPQLADRLRQQGQRRAQDFAVDRSVRQYEELFFQLARSEEAS